ncbi:unnamed protein product [Symbiodinium natans]|uniref:Uncharacterized protein n=1 Tax=Symbiodinium natans TaxID=878477 RepID=A0A812R417_9DINO|nr:unnamed protein product [Symbiodinium natans]
MAGRAFVVLAIAPLVAGQSCHALDVIHAHCQVSVTAQTSCKAVQDEMVSRVASISTGAWHDPHNNGIYSLESQTDAQLEFKRVTGNKMFTDKLKFDFEDVDGTCKIHGCSQSQIPSVADFSTNYCNLRMLYCGEDEGCEPVQYSFSVKEDSVEPSWGAGKDPSACLKTAKTATTIAV